MYEAILGYFVVLAWNCLASTLDYIVMQMRKINHEKGYWKWHSVFCGRNQSPYMKYLLVYNRKAILASHRANCVRFFLSCVVWNLSRILPLHFQISKSGTKFSNLYFFINLGDDWLQRCDCWSFSRKCSWYSCSVEPCYPGKNHLSLWKICLLDILPSSDQKTPKMQCPRPWKGHWITWGLV